MDPRLGRRGHGWLLAPSHGMPAGPKHRVVRGAAVGLCPFQDLRTRPVYPFEGLGPYPVHRGGTSVTLARNADAPGVDRLHDLVERLPGSRMLVGARGTKDWAISGLGVRQRWDEI
jgi:hypothetical protein